MTVAELIEKLKTFPQDAVVITTCASDYMDLDDDCLSLMTGQWDSPRHEALYDWSTPDGNEQAKKALAEGRPTTVLKFFKEGLIRHNGHLMILREGWWPRGEGERPQNPEYLTAVHIEAGL